MSESLLPKETVRSLIGLLSQEAKAELLGCLLTQTIPPSPVLVKAGVRAHYISPMSISAGRPELIVQINLAGETLTQTFHDPMFRTEGRSITDQLAPLWQQAAAWLATKLLSFPTCEMERIQ